MGAAHTPGPWNIVPYGDGDSLVICAGDGPDWRICFMATPGSSPRAWTRIQVDARLIAAAPELLEALQKFVDRAAGHGPITFSDDHGGCLQVARAALAKATGAA